MVKLLRLFLSFCFFTSFAQKTPDDFRKIAFSRYPQTSDNFRKIIDIGLRKYPESAMLWGEKATSYFKSASYFYAKFCINKAVELDSLNWLDYRGFMHCIFLKDYKAAIFDFVKIDKLRKDGFVMDHSYDFWIGLSYLVLNDYEKAQSYMDKNMTLRLKRGKEWTHPIEWFYLGILAMKQDQIDKAMESFDIALELFPNFPEPKYYKGILFLKKNNEFNARSMFKLVIEDLKRGYHLSEDNEIYVNYPYQITEFDVLLILEKSK